VARLRLLCRHFGVTEISSASESTLRLSPLQLVDSQQLRLKRLYPSANYRATTSTVQVRSSMIVGENPPVNGPAPAGAANAS